MEDCQIDGHVTYEELEKGDQVLMSENMLRWFPDLKVGDRIDVSLEVADKMVEKSFRIGAVGDYSQGISGANFLLPASVTEQIADEASQNGTELNLNDRCTIWLDRGLGASEKKAAIQELSELAGSSEYLETDSFEQHLNKVRPAGLRGLFIVRVLLKNLLAHR